MANIKVAVRVRPVSVRELNLTGSAVVVRAESNEISLTNLKVSSSKVGDSRERTRRYDFDYCFDSSNPEAKNYATQATIYETLGQSILDAMFSGYNSCLIAYGQSASGKTYTMMGTKEDPGLIPRLCEGIFSKIEQESEHERIYRVTVSYLEIYNEKVRDLLKPSTSSRSGLRVREHPRLGPYVQGLTHHVVRTLGSLISYVEEGTKARKTASTLQNLSSSRSHALLTVDLSQETAEHPNGSGTSTSSRRQDATPRGGSRLHLVDLAGSESAATCSGVHRLKEGANINKSLVALGNVISALAEKGSTGSRPGRRYIPYRDSSLTWLLKDALGGNATTIMLATISPASGSYNETAHTLRFAQRAQSVVNRPVVNEDPVERIIRELRTEVARLKSLLSEKDIDQTKACCCGKVQSSKDSTTDPQYHKEQESLNTSRSEKFDHTNKTVQLKDNRFFDVLSIRRFNSSDSVTAYETSSSECIRRFNSFEHLQLPDRFVSNYNRAKVTELNDEDDEVVDEINEVFVDIPTLVAVLIKPDDSLQEPSTQIEEICSDEVQEDSIDADFIDGSNEDFEGLERVDDDPDDRSSSTNSCILKDSEIIDLHQITSECSPPSPESVGRSRPRGKFSKQNSVDLPSSNLNISKKFGSIDGISKKKEPIVGVQRSHTNLEKRPTLTDRGKKLNNIREIDDRKANIKSGSIWRAIGNKDHLQRKSSNESDKSLKDSNRTGSYNNIGRKSSLESLKRKTSKDSSSSSSKDEQILISSLTRDKLTRRKSSLDQEAVTAAATAAGSLKHHTTIQRVKRAEIVAAVTERLYSSRKHTEETNMANSSVSDTRSPPESTDVKMPNSLIARSRLQEISRKMLMKRRRITVDTQTEAASTLRFKDMACLTDEPKVVLQDAAVLTDDHADDNVAVIATTDRRLPVLRVKDMATLTDRRPQTSIFRYKDAESLATDLDFDDYELHSPRNDSGILSDDTQHYAESNLSSADVSELYPEGGDKRVPCVDSSTNTFLPSSGRNSAVQTVSLEATNRQKNHSESRSCSRCCSLSHELCQHVRANSPEKNVISISLPEMISITIESTNGLESRIAVMDGSDATEEKSKPISSDKAAQTDEEIKNATEGSLLKDFTVKSTATQADGRVFRIENIFQDPRSKSYHNVTSDLKKETAMKKSVTFTSSLGTSSVIETKESDTETEWNGVYLGNIYQRTQSIPKGGLTQAFIIKKHSYSLNPRGSTQRFELSKNWTLPYPEKSPEFSDYNRAISTTSSFTQQDTKLELTDLSSSTMNSEYTFITIPEETQESCNQDSTDSCEKKNLKKSKSVSLKNLLNYDYNFSDDSLDYDEDNVMKKSTEVKTMDSHDDKNYESFCPPDVVAHTKKEALKSISHKNSTNIEPSIDDDFDDTQLEFPKRKPVEMSEKNPIQDYKTLILGMSSHIVNSDSEEEACTTQSDNISKKKVSFSNTNSLEKISDVVTNRKILASKQKSEVALKSIIKKKKKKPVVTESLDIIQSNIENDQFLQQRKIQSTKREEVLPALKENYDSENSEESLNDEKVVLSNEDHREDYSRNEVIDDCVVIDENIRTASKRNIFEEYMNEAITFMRNMNSINEYMSATNMMENYGKRRRRRGHRGNNPSTDKDHIKFRKVSLKDDTDKYLQPDNDEVVAVESYMKCLKGIERLEACIDKVSKHNQILRDKYGIDVESAGAKSNLASPSVDSKASSITDSAIHQCENAVSENDAENCDESNLSKISLPLLSSTRIDITKRPMLNEPEKCQALTEIDKHNLDDKNNNIKTEDDLERKIFDQLMGAADFSKRWSLKQSRQERLRKISDFRSQSPTTYSKLRGIFQQDTHGILNFDEVSTAEDYLGHIHGIESSSWRVRKTKLSDQMDNSLTTSIDFKINSEEFCNESPENYSNLSDIEASNEPMIFQINHDYLTDPTKSIKVKQTPYVEKEITHRSKNNLRTELNPRFGDSFIVELKYPGSPRAKFLELLKERRRIVENSRGTNAF